MKASDLIGLEVVDSAGRSLGKVTGLRCVQDGPVRGLMALPRVDSLIVHRRKVGAFLGYQLRDEQSGPAAVDRLLRWMHRDAQLIAWPDVASWSKTGVVTRT